MASLGGLHQLGLLLHFWSSSRLSSMFQSKIGSEGALGRHDMWNGFADFDSVGHSLQNKLEQGGN